MKQSELLYLTFYNLTINRLSKKYIFQLVILKCIDILKYTEPLVSCQLKDRKKDLKHKSHEKIISRYRVCFLVKVGDREGMFSMKVKGKE